MSASPDNKTNSREAFFFGSGEDALYAMAHRPATDNGQAVIFCAPFADDVQRSYRLTYNFGEKLAEAGYLALRFDYRGCGDSAGIHEETDLVTRLEDINRAIALVQDKYGVENLTLIGLRLGANLACMAVENNRTVKRLILWEPIISGEKYFYDCLRSNIVSQAFIYRKVIRNREQQLEGLRKGKPVNIDGYEVNRSLFEAGCRLDLRDQVAGISIPTLLVSIQAGQRPLSKETTETMKYIIATESNASHKVVDEVSFWVNKNQYVPSSPGLYDLTFDWLKEHG